MLICSTGSGFFNQDLPVEDLFSQYLPVEELSQPVEDFSQQVEENPHPVATG